MRYVLLTCWTWLAGFGAEPQQRTKAAGAAADHGSCTAEGNELPFSAGQSEVTKV